MSLLNDARGKINENLFACRLNYIEKVQESHLIACLLQLLDKRIETFINSYRSSNISYPDTKPYVDDELNKLQRQWDAFKNQSLLLKNKLTSAQQYFNLLETVSRKKILFLKHLLHFEKINNL